MKTNGTAVHERPRTLDFVNPATGEHFGQLVMSTRDDVLAAREALRRANPRWAATPVAERARILRRFQQLLIEATDEITAVINRDCGKTRQDALIELFITVNILDQYTRNAARWLKRERVSRGLYFFRRYYIERRPYGTVAVIGPWNYPFVQMVHPICTALLAGNTVLVKSSEVTAATGQLIETLFQRVPELAPYIRFVHGDAEVGKMVIDSRPDLVFITGSTPTGRKVLRRAADDLTPVIYELGGNDPMIVLEDADIPAAARWGAWGAFFNAGQTCMAVERVYVIDSVYEEFLRHLRLETARLKMGYTTDTDSPFDLGPLTFERQVQIAEEHLQDALGKGAVVVEGGRRKEMFMEPTILVNVDHDMKVMQEETFSPILPVMKVQDEAEAIALANDCQYGLSASVWSRDIARAEAVAARIEAGTLLVNDTMSHYAVPLLPFGGVKASGNGRIHGREDLRQFTLPHSYSVGVPPQPMDIATVMRFPGHYRLGKTVMHAAFGVGPKQRLAPVTEALGGEERARVVAGAGLLGALAAVVVKLVRWRR